MQCARHGMDVARRHGMRHVIHVLISASVAAACAETAPPPTPPRQPLGSVHVAPPRTAPPDTQPKRVVVPPQVRTFSTMVAELAIVQPSEDHRPVVHALRALADAIEVLVPRATVDIVAIRRAADQLELSVPTSTMHADYVRFALDAAVRATAAVPPHAPTSPAEYHRALQQLIVAVEAVDEDTGLLSQHDAVSDAFAAVNRTLHAALGAPAPGTAVSTRPLRNRTQDR